MKRHVVLTIGISVPAFLFWTDLGLSVGAMSFEDPKVKMVIEYTLGLSDPNESDMLSLTQLNLAMQGIRSVSGLEVARNLVYLDLSQNPIEDISSLGGLSSLKHLNLGGTRIQRLDTLKDICGLVELDLSGNDLEDISALRELKKLRTLTLASNRISDISSLANMCSLEELDLRRNQIGSLSPLRNLTSIRKLLLSGNRVQDISPLGSLGNLEILDLEENELTDISTLSRLTRLTELNLGKNELREITGLSELSRLTKLMLYGNQITDILELTQLRQLEHLDVSNNPIRETAELMKLRERRFFKFERLPTVTKYEMTFYKDVDNFGGIARKVGAYPRADRYVDLRKEKPFVFWNYRGSMHTVKANAFLGMPISRHSFISVVLMDSESKVLVLCGEGIFAVDGDGTGMRQVFHKDQFRITPVYDFSEDFTKLFIFGLNYLATPDKKKTTLVILSTKRFVPEFVPLDSIALGLAYMRPDIAWLALHKGEGVFDLAQVTLSEHETREVNTIAQSVESNSGIPRFFNGIPVLCNRGRSGGYVLQFGANRVPFETALHYIMPTESFIWVLDAEGSLFRLDKQGYCSRMAAYDKSAIIGMGTKGDAVWVAFENETIHEFTTSRKEAVISLPD